MGKNQASCKHLSPAGGNQMCQLVTEHACKMLGGFSSADAYATCSYADCCATAPVNISGPYSQILGWAVIRVKCLLVHVWLGGMPQSLLCSVMSCDMNEHADIWLKTK